VVIDDGSVIEVREEQFSNANAPRFESDVGNVLETTEQRQKASSPIAVTEGGIIMLERVLRLWKAATPTLATFDSTITLVTLIGTILFPE